MRLRSRSFSRILIFSEKLSEAIYFRHCSLYLSTLTSQIFSLKALPSGKQPMAREYVLETLTIDRSSFQKLQDSRVVFESPCAQRQSNQIFRAQDPRLSPRL